MKTNSYLFLIAFYYSISLSAQPSIQWQESLGGSLDDAAYSIQQTMDLGYVFAGSALSTDGDILSNNGEYDFWIVKLDDLGNIVWNKTYGGSHSEIARSISQTFDGGYIIAGFSNSNDSDVSGNHGSLDFWIIKLDSSGTLIWQKSLGGTRNDEAKSIKQTLDGGYVVVGYSFSNDGDVTSHHGSADTSDVWIVKLDVTGNVEWEKSLGGTNNESANSIGLTSDSGFVICGSSASNDGDVSGNHGSIDLWVTKINNTGSILWQNSFGGSGIDEANSIQQTIEGDYIITGSTTSIDGDVTANHGSGDYWIIKTDGSGNLKWQKTFGGTDGENSFSVRQTFDRGFIIAGTSRSLDGDVTGHHGSSNSDFWVVKIDSLGIMDWQKSIGGFMHDTPYSISETNDGGCIISGYSMSSSGDATFNHGDYDAWIVKLDSLESVSVDEIQNSFSDFQISPNPFSKYTTISFDKSLSVNCKIEIVDLNGQVIKTLDSKKLLGENKIMWDATDNSGNRIGNGVYFIKIFTDGKSETRRIVVVGN